MKKYILLMLYTHLCVGLPSVTPADTPTQKPKFEKIEQSLIQAHAYLFKHELERAYRNRIIVGCAGVLAAIASAYWLYKIWPTMPPLDQSQKPGTNGQNGQSDAGNQINTSCSKSWFMSKLHATGHLVKSGVISAINIIPAAIALLFINTTGATIATKAIQKCEHYYRPLNWKWILTEKTALETRCQHLLHYVALLDNPHSPQFDVLKNTQINWHTTTTLMNTQEADEPLQQQAPVVTAREICNPSLVAQYVPLNTFDELVKLQLLARYGEKLDPATKDAVARQCVTAWNSLVGALTHCLGYLTYKLANAQTSSAVMQEQLRDIVHEITVHTNALASELPRLINTTEPQTPGIIAHVYTYCKLLKDLCSALEINPILA